MLRSLITGAGLGAGLAYFFDPDRGNRRRALVRNQIDSLFARSNRAADCTWRDMRNRMQGVAAQVTSIGRSGNASDDVLVNRVRSKMGRYVSHPSAIEVLAHDGHVILTGPILAEEVEPLLSAVRSVEGVREVENQLEPHDSRGNISALQGGVHRTGEPFELMQSYWSPTTRTIVGGAGVGLMANCLLRRTPTAMLLGTAGFAAFLRALTNMEMGRALGISGGRKGVDIEKTITINAPVEAVFQLLSDKTNYPRLTDMVREVKDLGGGHYQKSIALPGGGEMLLDEVITRSVPNEFLAFRSGPDSAMQYSGRAHFEPRGQSATRVHIQLTYNPPGGVLSHAAAAAIGLDPKALFDDILMRAKSFLETGRQPHDAAEHTPPTAGTGLGEPQGVAAQQRAAQAGTMGAMRASANGLSES